MTSYEEQQYQLIIRTLKPGGGLDRLIAAQERIAIALERIAAASDEPSEEE